ncbi:MAG: Fe-S cluster assembly ATPase SufC [Mariprofundales bacterium]
MLQIHNLHVTVDNKPVLKGLDLNISSGSVHAIMGPNGAGKSTLSHVLAGKDGYEITQGTILFFGQDLLAMSVEERAWSGLFLAFQYPVEIPGVNNLQFLRAGVNAARKYRGELELDAYDFLGLARQNMGALQLDESFMRRSVNEGFSGGEKKRNEIFQMSMLEPKLAVLDESDSGLDIDALRIVAEGVNNMRNPKRSMIIVTHYQRLLDYIEPDAVHVLANGRIIKSGDKTLALELEKRGYDWLLESGTSK